MRLAWGPGDSRAMLWSWGEKRPSRRMYGWSERMVAAVEGGVAVGAGAAAAGVAMAGAGGAMAGAATSGRTNATSSTVQRQPWRLRKRTRSPTGRASMTAYGASVRARVAPEVMSRATTWK